MRIKHFVYAKQEEQTEPQVLVMHENGDYIEGIDITKFDPKEVIALFDIQRAYEKQIEPFIKKGYRRYRKDKVKEVLGESNEPPTNK